MSTEEAKYSRLTINGDDFIILFAPIEDSSDKVIFGPITVNKIVRISNNAKDDSRNERKLQDAREELLEKAKQEARNGLITFHLHGTGLKVRTIANARIETHKMTDQLVELVLYGNLTGVKPDYLK